MNAKLTKIFISPESNYYKHKKGSPGKAPTYSPHSVVCHAGHGLVGDRFYDFKKDFGGQVSIMGQEALIEMAKDTGSTVDFSVFRRNLIISGIDPLELQGVTFSIGEVIFEGHSDCTPCAWMDFAAGAGTHDWLNQNNKGGLRARIIKSGTINLGDKLSL